MPLSSVPPAGGLATAMPDIVDFGPLTLGALIVLVLAGPYVRRDAARLLRAVAEVLESPGKP